ncbi:SGNH/GDSL hydrolase family protein [Thalassomonas haliotis]|uniref:SGNH/GDSL hydrolase family protein n=1 Tax=Thalassomonas haliotis TaxID=485448 RepID=A0ABY7VK21_9GAMM|nr:hypothetical protein [Thalassomonas haliotis]WDE14089.1 SGNH/GDSL hydrolase family protein [Thalassomonas haliotis]
MLKFSYLKSVKRLFSSLFITISFLSSAAWAGHKSSEAPLLIIGASYANATTPFFSDLQAPLAGTAVNSGTYLSLGNALIRERSLSGHVINEGQAGATSFTRLGCYPGPECVGPGWDSYDTQFQKALARVSSRDNVNANYLVIVKGNDCMHPDAFGIKMELTMECTQEQMNASIDNLIAVGKKALEKGITPIYGYTPAYENLELEVFRAALGWPWIIGEESYNNYRDLYRTRLENEMPEAMIVDFWKGFEHMGDGLHPSRKTVTRAAKRIARAIRRHQRAL